VIGQLLRAFGFTKLGGASSHFPCAFLQSAHLSDAIVASSGLTLDGLDLQCSFDDRAIAEQARHATAVFLYIFYFSIFFFFNTIFNFLY